MDSQQAAFGTSAAAMIERHLAFVLRRFRVDVEDAPVHLADLMEASTGLLLSVEKGAPREEQLEYVAIQLGHVALGFEPTRKPVAMFSDRERAEYARVVGWAAWALIPDQAMFEAEREEWDDRRLAHELGVTLRMAQIRIKQWRKPARIKRAPQLGEVVELRSRVAAASEPPPIRYEPGQRIKGLQVPIPEDRERFLRETTKRWKDGESRFF